MDQRLTAFLLLLRINPMCLYVDAGLHMDHPAALWNAGGKSTERYFILIFILVINRPGVGRPRTCPRESPAA